jgi:hypothetical protein
LSKWQAAFPYNNATGYNLAVFTWENSDSNFNAGLKDDDWNLDYNTIGYVNVVQAGQATPAGPNRSRWMDFLDAISPIPNSNQVFVGGSFTDSNSTSRHLVFSGYNCC